MENFKYVGSLENKIRIIYGNYHNELKEAEMKLEYYLNSDFFETDKITECLDKINKIQTRIDKLTFYLNNTESENDA